MSDLPREQREETAAQKAALRQILSVEYGGRQAMRLAIEALNKADADAADVRAAIAQEKTR